MRDDAPWRPWNIEFIRRINGLDSVDDVYRTVFDASYLVLGLGDVYLGAPVATPLDPRHRLVTTKYNPARTWTAENSVGIGGAYLCIYGMEGPGGYQFVGRTVQVWNRFRRGGLFEREPLGAPAFRPHRVVPGVRGGTARAARGDRRRTRPVRDAGRHVLPRRSTTTFLAENAGIDRRLPRRISPPRSKPRSNAGRKPASSITATIPTLLRRQRLRYPTARSL